MTFPNDIRERRRESESASFVFNSASEWLAFVASAASFCPCPQTGAVFGFGSMNSFSSPLGLLWSQLEVHGELMNSTFNDLFKKAHGALATLRGQNNIFLGKDGEIVYSKNNVCVHESSVGGVPEVDESNVVHTPGYLTIHCLNDEFIGVTLVLQWLPNATLEKNPSSIRCVSPRSRAKISNGDISAPHNNNTGPPVMVEPTIAIEEEASTSNERPQTLTTSDCDLGVPSINVIPNTPVDPGHKKLLDGFNEDELVAMKKASESSRSHDAESTGSGHTSGADEFSDKEDMSEASSVDESEEEAQKIKSLNLGTYRKTCESFLDKTPEQFAQEHNLILNTGSKMDDSSILAMAKDKVMFQQRPASNSSLFSVNLGKMRSMRLFFSNPDCTSGQLVIASNESQYKILHFHHGGLDKLAKLFEQWNALKSRSVKDGSPSPLPDRQLLICQPEISRTELDPEDGLYTRVGLELWKTYMGKDGSIDDNLTVRKTVYFTSMEPSVRKEVWPFLLRVYTWNSTFEQRETVRNDLFLEYQNIKRKRMKKMGLNQKNILMTIESTIWKDVVRTDRCNPYFSGDNNPNLEVMKEILLNYASVYPEINYIQGMSDLLAPILVTLKNESDSYWCFSGLMHQTLFCTTANAETNAMEMNLEYLRELMKLMEPKFFQYLVTLGGDALQLMFVHRWLLLFFKREFPESNALHIWEACWSMYRTKYFHLFVAVAIVSIYGPDVISQGLPHDEILLYFSSLAMHMDAGIVLKKARGLLYNFYRLDRIPCTLADLMDHDASTEQWSSHMPQHVFECTRVHGQNEPCPFANQA